MAHIPYHCFLRWLGLLADRLGTVILSFMFRDDVLTGYFLSNNWDMWPAVLARKDCFVLTAAGTETRAWHLWPCSLWVSWVCFWFLLAAMESDFCLLLVTVADATFLQMVSAGTLSVLAPCKHNYLPCCVITDFPFWSHFPHSLTSEIW